MPEIDRALAEIAAMRAHLARGELHRGLGPVAMAATGALAALVAGVQGAAFADAGVAAYLATWVGTAAIAAAIVAAELVTRSRRYHSRLADAMIATAVADFLPAAGAGALLLVVLARCEPAALWMLPGLWQVLVALGLFAASRTLPRAVVLVGAFYLVAGCGVLALAAATHAPTPAMMGVPFAAGQLGLALVLHLGLRHDDHAA